MSHFVVGVLCNEPHEVEDLLAPYQENNMGDCPRKFMEFEDGTADIKEYYEQSDKKDSMTIDEYAEDEGYTKHKGVYGYWHNPNCKWDWYQVGGRWSGFLRLKPNATSGDMGEKSWANEGKEDDPNRVDIAQLKDIDFSPDKKEYKRAEREWELRVEGAEPKNEKEEKTVQWGYNKEYYIKTYKTKERFANYCASFHMFALVDPDGGWHEGETMGWFGCSSGEGDDRTVWGEKFYDEYIKGKYEDLYLVVVDCHI